MTKQQWTSLCKLQTNRDRSSWELHHFNHIEYHYMEILYTDRCTYSQVIILPPS